MKLAASASHLSRYSGCSLLPAQLSLMKGQDQARSAMTPWCGSSDRDLQ
jgi:hypothetical protein